MLHSHYWRFAMANQTKLVIRVETESGSIYQLSQWTDHITPPRLTRLGGPKTALSALISDVSVTKYDPITVGRPFAAFYVDDYGEVGNVRSTNVTKVDTWIA